MNFVNKKILSKKISRYKDFNKKNFKKINSNSKILIEFNAFHNFHVLGSFLSNILSKNNNSEIVGFFNYNLVTRKNKFSLFEKIKIFIAKNLKLGFFGIYSSFGTKKIIYPYFDKKIKLKTSNFLKNINKKKINEDFVQSLSVNDILIGDLVLDSYIKYFKEYEIDFNSKKFRNYLRDFIQLFFFWEKYIENNNITAIIGAHCYYAYGIILRICINKDIPTYVLASSRLLRLNKKALFTNDQYKYSNKIFNSFTLDQKSRSYEFSKKILEKKFSGTTGLQINEPTTVQSVFKSFNSSNKILSLNNKVKILIATHEIYDATHAFGKNFFPSFKTWLNNLGEISEITDYDWYIKDHAIAKGMKMETTQKLTQNLTIEICEKYKKIKILDPNTSHHQLINEGIDYVLTVFGSIVYEYAYFNIPVIAASSNHYFKNFNFFIQPKNKDEYFNILKNLEKKSYKFDKNEIFKFYFMQYIFNGHTNVLNNYNDFLKDHKYDQYCSPLFYDFFINNNDKKKIDILKKNLQNFIYSGDYFMNPFHNGYKIEDVLLNNKKNL